MRTDQVESLICHEVEGLLEDLAREAAQGATTLEGRVRFEFDTAGVPGDQASAALQMVAGRIR